jgi:hypothetical protein
VELAGSRTSRRADPRLQRTFAGNPATLGDAVNSHSLPFLTSALTRRVPPREDSTLVLARKWVTVGRPTEGVSPDCDAAEAGRPDANRHSMLPSTTARPRPKPVLILYPPHSRTVEANIRFSRYKARPGYPVTFPAVWTSRRT